MGDKKKQKFSLGDIIRKLNETKESDDSQKSKKDAPQTPVDEQRALTDSTFPHATDAGEPVSSSSLNSDKAESSCPTDSPTRTVPQQRFAAHQDPGNGVSSAGSHSHENPRPHRSPPALQETSENEEGANFDLMRYIGIVIRRKNIIIAVVVVASLVSIVQYMKAERFYTAHSRMLFSPGYQDIMGNNQALFIAWGSREEKFSTHLELLKSQTVMKRVSDNLNKKISPAALSSGMRVSRGLTDGAKNDIIDVSFSHPDAEIARDAVNEICRTYVEYIKDVSVQDITYLIVKLEDQIDKKEKELGRKENALRVFKENHRSVQLSSEANMTISKIAQIETQRQQTQLDMLAGREKFVGLKKEIDQQQVDIIQSITYQNPYQSRLAELELELNTLSAEYSSEHFKVRMVKAEIEKIKEAMKSDIVKEASSKTVVKNPIRQSLLQDLISVTIEKSALDAKRNAQEQIFQDLEGELRKLPAVELQFAQLTRETESLLQVLKLLKTRFEEAKIKHDSQDSDLKILEVAQTPTTAIATVRSSKIFMTMLIAFIIGVALALLLEYLDQSIKEPQDVERLLEVPLLGIVPMIETEKAIIESSKDRGKTVLEPFRALRATLKHIAENRQSKTFIISSAVKGEGKTTLAANIAITFAMDGRKVILVDGDLRRAQMHSLFHLTKKNGLCDYLCGALGIQDILKSTIHQNLSVITAGEHPQNPAELVGSHRFDMLVSELRSIADIIIFDSPALLPVSDVLSMAPKVDACVMVVRALWTPFKAAQQAKSQLNRIGCVIVGAILNGISLSRGYYPYYYGYYRYYSYKYSYDDERESKFSLRKFGLNIESQFKETVQTVRLSIPRWVHLSLDTVRRLVRRKTFWILLVLAVFLSFADLIMIRFRPLTQAKQRITFIGPITQSSTGSGLSMQPKSSHPTEQPMPLEGISPTGEEKHSGNSKSTSQDSAHHRGPAPAGDN